MAYSALADVQRLIKWVEFDATSKVTSTEVTTYFIAEADTFIDAKLSRVYEVPITDSDDIDILKYISCRIAACEIANVLIVQANGDLSEIVQRWCEQAKERLLDILTQDILLENSTLLDASGTGRLYSFTAHGNDTYDAPDPIWYINNNASTKINQW